jgi:predicted HicB family RNase H-like nuclease
VEYSKEDECLFGKVVGIKSLLSYEGNSIQELEKDFQTVIEEYLADCEERDVQPEQPYKGTFNVRISPELHRTIAIYAMEHGETLNAAVEEAIGKMVANRPMYAVNLDSNNPVS